MKIQQIKMLFPSTLDELEAEMENELLEDGKQARVEIEQDHQQHIIIHAKLEESNLRDEHVKIHKQAMYFWRKNQQVLGVMQQQQPIAMQGQPQVNMTTEATPPEQQI